MNVIQKLTNEAYEILANIHTAARNGDITWQQRDETGWCGGVGGRRRND